MDYEISSVSLDYVSHFSLQPDLYIQQQPIAQVNGSKGNQSEAASYLEGDLKMPVACDVIKQKLDEINEKLVGAYKRVEYTFNERPKACIMTIVDTRSGEVIKEIPSKEILNMVADIWDRFGILVDEKR